MPDNDNTEHSVHTVAQLHASAEQRASRHQRIIETFTITLGRPATLYLLMGLIVLWISLNLLRHRPLDPPPFVWLQGTIGLLSLLLTTIVLITQNRLGKMAERRALLDLHVNLLAEQKIAKLIALVEELRRDMPQVVNRRDLQAEQMSQPVDAHAAVVDLERSIETHIEEALERSVEESEESSSPPVDDPGASRS